MSFAITAVSISAAAGIGGGLISAFTGQQPSAPNLAQASAQATEFQSELLPELRQLQAEAEIGGQGMVPGYVKTTDKNGKTVYYQMNPGVVQSTDANGNQIFKGPTGKTFTLGEVIAGKKPVPASQATFDFFGKGLADVEGQLAQQLAQGQLSSEQQFDPQFIAQNLALEQQANPEGFAARASEYQDIQNAINNPITSPVSNQLDTLAQQKMAAGSGLTESEQQMLDQAVAQGTAARGGGTVPTDFSRDLTTGFSGAAREMGNTGQDISWLQSGVTPGDIQTQQEQQNLGNLSQYISGGTPQSQFARIAGAQQGATPIASGPSLPGENFNAGTQGANAAVNQYSDQVNQALGTQSNWMTGLSALLGAGRIGAAAGGI